MLPPRYTIGYEAVFGVRHLCMVYVPARPRRGWLVVRVLTV